MTATGITLTVKFTAEEAIWLDRANDALDGLIADALANAGRPLPLDRPAVTAGAKLAAGLVMAGIA
jgi:hypothetical protein